MDERDFDITDAKKILQKQLQLLSERSEHTGDEFIGSITNAMVAIAQELSRNHSAVRGFNR